MYIISTYTLSSFWVRSTFDQRCIPHYIHLDTGVAQIEHSTRLSCPPTASHSKYRGMAYNDGGWEVPKHTTRRKKATNSASREHLSRLTPGLTSESLMKEYEGMMKQWYTTTCASTTTRQVKACGAIDVVSAFCLGTGSFSLDTERRRRSLWQLIFFMHIVSIRKIRNSTTPCGPKRTNSI